MIYYLDSSALVKRYISEPGSDELAQALADAEAVGTVVVSRAEVVAALSKAVRTGSLVEEDAEAVRRLFTREWPSFLRLRVTELLIGHAADLAWELGLRGYDSVQLAAAVLWQEGIAAPVAMATFDRRLWTAAGQVGLEPFPEDLPTLLDAWATRIAAPPNTDHPGAKPTGSR